MSGRPVSERPPPRVMIVTGPHDGARSDAHTQALRVLGCEVSLVDSTPYFAQGPALAVWLRRHLVAGSALAEFNRHLLEAAKSFMPHLVWADELVAVRPATLGRLRDLGVVLACHVREASDGPGRERRVRLLREALPLFDLVVRAPGDGEADTAEQRGVLERDPEHRGDSLTVTEFGRVFRDLCGRHASIPEPGNAAAPTC